MICKPGHAKNTETHKKARFACFWPDHAKRASSKGGNAKASMGSYGPIGAISIGEALPFVPLVPVPFSPPPLADFPAVFILSLFSHHRETFPFYAQLAKQRVYLLLPICVVYPRDNREWARCCQRCMSRERTRESAEAPERCQTGQARNLPNGPAASPEPAAGPFAFTPHPEPPPKEAPP